MVNLYRLGPKSEAGMDPTPLEEIVKKTKVTCDPKRKRKLPEEEMKSSKKKVYTISSDDEDWLPDFFRINYFLKVGEF